MDPNVAIAIFTAVAAIAALISVFVSLRASRDAKKSAEESKNIAEEQTKVLLTAAKANALATQIDVYTLQMHRLNAHGRAAKELDELEQKQKHLAGWLERQTDALGVGLNNQLPDSTKI
jgi:uncharacterized lipoprotein YehR (DUF1307 family)